MIQRFPVRLRHSFFWMAILALTLSLACPKRPSLPNWAQAAPEGCVLAVSFNSSLILKARERSTLFDHYPMAANVLDVFLSKANINPENDPSRITLYAFDRDVAQAAPNPNLEDTFLIQVGDLSDPKATLAALTPFFPTEGHLQIDKDRFPLHVILDIDQHHFRMLLDKAGRLWLGELRALERLKKTAPFNASLQKTTEWINPAANIQGFASPKHLIDQFAKGPNALDGLNLPKDIQYLAWSIQSDHQPKDTYALQLALTGTRESIEQSEPWARRLAGLLTSTQAGNAQPPEIMQAKDRLGLRANVNQAQGEKILKQFLEAHKLKDKASQ